MWADGSALAWSNWVRDGEWKRAAEPNGGTTRNHVVMAKKSVYENEEDRGYEEIKHRWATSSSIASRFQLVCQLSGDFIY